MKVNNKMEKKTFFMLFVCVVRRMWGRETFFFWDFNKLWKTLTNLFLRWMRYITFLLWHSRACKAGSFWPLTFPSFTLLTPKDTASLTKSCPVVDFFMIDREVPWLETPALELWTWVLADILPFSPNSRVNSRDSYGVPGNILLL